MKQRIYTNCVDLVLVLHALDWNSALSWGTIKTQYIRTTFSPLSKLIGKGLQPCDPLKGDLLTPSLKSICIHARLIIWCVYVGFPSLRRETRILKARMHLIHNEVD